jgi:hypothetical protein
MMYDYTEREGEGCLLTHDLVDEDVGTVEGHGPVGPAKDPTEGLEGQGWKGGTGWKGGGVRSGVGTSASSPPGPLQALGHG